MNGQENLNASSAPQGPHGPQAPQGPIKLRVSHGNVPAVRYLSEYYCIV